MAGPSHNCRVIVLRKTKLGESDLILTMLSSDGSQLRAVAKGARKPQSPFSARLELYSVADVLIASGRSLGIVQEARAVSSNAALHASLELSACAAPIAELLWRVSQEGLPVPRLFDCTQAAFDALENAAPEDGPRICAAALIKILAFCGFRPSLACCVSCGAPVDAPLNAAGEVCFSAIEGGVVCQRCRAHVESVRVPWAAVRSADALLRSTFADVVASPVDQRTVFAVLQLEHQWIREHVSCSMKSLSFLFSCGLF